MAKVPNITIGVEVVPIPPRGSKIKGYCICCGEPIRLMCQVQYCGGLCQDGECGHDDNSSR